MEGSRKTTKEINTRLGKGLENYVVDRWCEKVQSRKEWNGTLRCPHHAVAPTKNNNNRNAIVS